MPPAHIHKYTNVNTKPNETPGEVTMKQLRPAVPGVDIPVLLYDLLKFGAPLHSEQYTIVKSVIWPFLARLNSKNIKAKLDEACNMRIVVGEGNKDIMFSCHMDTVHWAAGHSQATPKFICVTPMVAKSDQPDKLQGYVFGATQEGNKLVRSVLGADDKIGCYIMLKMIEAGINGTYVFHSGEEKGCVGSRHILNKDKEWLKTFKMCIAFDRAGYTDVIAHQHGGRCASIAFTNQLAGLINTAGNMPTSSMYTGDVRGVFTDSAVYKDIIPECTNISVGYFSQHGEREHTDYYWLATYLLPALLKLNWGELKAERDPTAVTTHTYERYGGADDYTGHGSYHHSSVLPKKEILDVGEFTELYRIPEYPLRDGIVPKLTAAAMKRLIQAQLFRSSTEYATKKHAADIYDLMLEKEYMQAVVDESKDILGDFLESNGLEELFTAFLAENNYTPLEPMYVDDNVVSEDTKSDEGQGGQAVVQTEATPLALPAPSSKGTRTLIKNWPIKLYRSRLNACIKIRSSLPKIHTLDKPLIITFNDAQSILKRAKKIIGRQQKEVSSEELADMNLACAKIMMVVKKMPPHKGGASCYRAAHELLSIMSNEVVEKVYGHDVFEEPGISEWEKTLHKVEWSKSHDTGTTSAA